MRQNQIKEQTRAHKKYLFLLKVKCNTLCNFALTLLVVSDSTPNCTIFLFERRCILLN